MTSLLKVIRITTTVISITRDYQPRYRGFTVIYFFLPFFRIICILNEPICILFKIKQKKNYCKNISTIKSAGFVGAQHLHALVRLLGYQGVAVVVGELLGVARGLLHGTLAQFTRALAAAMPRHCKLPRYDYGSNGKFG